MVAVVAVPARTRLPLLCCAARTIVTPKTKSTSKLLTARRYFGASSPSLRQSLDPRNKLAPKDYLGKEIVDDYAILRDQYGEFPLGSSEHTTAD